LGVQALDFDRQLQDLETKKLALEEKELHLKLMDKHFSELVDKYEILHNELEDKKGEIMAKARSDAKKMLAETNRIIENTIRKIKESQADKTSTKEAREELTKYTELLDIQPTSISITESKQEKLESMPQKALGTPKIGDYVRVEGHTGVGELLEADGNQAVVAIGNIKFRTRIANLEKLDSKQAKSYLQPKVKIKLAFDINQKATEFSPHLDIKGFRAEEAILELRRWIDDAILLGIKELRITHGKGDGILREVVRQTLKSIHQVKGMRDEHPDRGGTGVTYIEL